MWAFDCVLILSVPIERSSLDWEHHDAGGRLFTPLAPDYLQQMFERSGFNLLENWESPDAQGRAGHSWCTFLFVARHPGPIARSS